MNALFPKEILKSLIDKLPIVKTFDPVLIAETDCVEIPLEFIDFLRRPHEYSEIEDDSK